MSDLQILRAVLAYARRAGWSHRVMGVAGFTPIEHMWRRNERMITWDGVSLVVMRPDTGMCDWRPASLGEAVHVLVAAGFVPVNALRPGPSLAYCPCCGEYVTLGHHRDDAPVLAEVGRG